jgi:uncharacterized repeat protein (TIGR01451 family)
MSPIGTVTKNTFFRYRIEIKNNGPLTATNVQLTDVLPNRVSFTSRSFTTGGGASCTSGQTVTCTFPTINSGDSKIVLITVKALLTGNAFNTASVTLSEPDPIPVNNSSSNTVTIINP